MFVVPARKEAAYRLYFYLPSVLRTVLIQVCKPKFNFTNLALVQERFH